jgi:chromate transporter
LLEKELVNNNGWVTKDELIDYFALSQITPGAIAINTANFIGYKIKGVIGSITATLGMVMPSLIIIMVIAKLLQQFSDMQIVQHAFAGVRVAVVVLIAQTLYFLIKTSIKGKLSSGLFFGAFLLISLWDINPVYIIILSAVIGYFRFPRQGGQTK